MTLRLNRVPAVIKPGSSIKDATTSATSESAKPTRFTEVELHLEVDVSQCIKAMEALFPGADAMCKLIAAESQENKGLDLRARTGLPEMNVKIWYGDETEPAVDVVDSPIKAKVSMRIDQDGDAKIILKPRVKLNNKQLTDMVQLVKAEVKLSLEPSQMLIPSEAMPLDDGESAGKKSKSGKKAELKAPVLDQDPVRFSLADDAH